MGCLLLMVLAKQFYPKRFHEFIMLPLSNKYFLIQGKNDELSHPFNLLLFLLQVISVSLFIYLFLKIYDPLLPQQHPSLFVQIVTAYIVFAGIKFSIEKIVGDIFSIDGLVNNYLYQKLSYRNLFGVLFFIANLLFFYVVEPTLLVLIILSSVVLIANALILFYSYKSNRTILLSNFFYFILYLCALEISPYVIMYKAFL